MDKQLTGTIECWRKEQATDKEFIIRGYIYDDTQGRWRDGTWFHTSGIMNREVSTGDVVVTRNSVYKLGKARDETST